MGHLSTQERQVIGILKERGNMSVLIDMKMPAKCDECCIRALALARCQATGKSTSHHGSGRPMDQNRRPKWCPIVSELSANVGDILYYTANDEVKKIRAVDVSVNGLVRTESGEWVRPDTNWFFRTEEEAREHLAGYAD